MVDATDEDGTWINGDIVEPEKPDPLNSSYSGKNFEYDCQLDKEDGVPSGYGKAYDSKKSWTGDWRYGYIYGIAEVKYYNGERFTGTLDNNQPLTGTYTWPDRYSFEGTFKNGHASGIGLLIGLGGVFYAGYVRDTLMNGYGKLYKADGTFIKEGIWQNNKFLLNKKDSNLAIEKIVQIKLQKIKDLNTARDINNPVSIFTDSTWKNVQLEEYNVLLVTKKDGSIWRLGKNDHTSTNQLLTEVVDKYYTSVEVGKPNEWKTIKCLGHFSVGLKNDGTIWKWVSGKPVQIGTGKEWASIDEDRYEAVLIKNDGTLWSYYDRDTAVKQMGLDNDWVKIFCGHNGCGFAQKRDGTIWGWGANENGQLGSGDDYNIKELRCACRRNNCFCKELEYCLRFNVEIADTKNILITGKP